MNAVILALVFLTIVSILCGWWTAEYFDIVNFVVFNPPLGFPEFIQIGNAIVSVILSGLLVYLYSQQKDILSEQKDLGESRERAELHLTDYLILSGQDLLDIFPSEKEHAYEEVSDDWNWIFENGMLMFSVSNIGKGVARNLTSEVYFDPEGYREVAMGSIMKRGSVFKSHIFGRSIVGQYAFNDMGGAIGGNERNVEFSNFLFFESECLSDELEEFNKSQSYRLAPSEILWILADAGVTSVEVGIKFHYEDGTGKQYTRRLNTVRVDPRQYSDFADVMYNGEPVESKTRDKSSILSYFYD